MTEKTDQTFSSFAEEVKSNPEMARGAVESVFDDLELYMQSMDVEPPTAEDLFMACLYAMILASLAPANPQPPEKFLKLAQAIDGKNGTDFVKLLPAVRELRNWCAGHIEKYFEARADAGSSAASTLDDNDIPF